MLRPPIGRRAGSSDTVAVVTTLLRLALAVHCFCALVVVIFLDALFAVMLWHD